MVENPFRSNTFLHNASPKRRRQQSNLDGHLHYYEQVLIRWGVWAAGLDESLSASTTSSSSTSIGVLSSPDDARYHFIVLQIRLVYRSGCELALKVVVVETPLPMLSASLSPSIICGGGRCHRFLYRCRHCHLHQSMLFILSPLIFFRDFFDHICVIWERYFSTSLLYF